jgi:hypothetical protein
MEELLESVSVAGLPDSDSWEGYEGWTAGLVCAVIEAVARATDEGPEELLEAAIRSARFKVERAKLDAKKEERDLSNMARERLLPDEKTLEKVARYDATPPESSTRLYTSWEPCRSGDGRRRSPSPSRCGRIGGELRAGLLTQLLGKTVRQQFAVRLNHDFVGTLAFAQKVFSVRVYSDGEAGPQQCKSL